MNVSSSSLHSLLLSCLLIGEDIPECMILHITFRTKRHRKKINQKTESLMIRIRAYSASNLSRSVMNFPPKLLSLCHVCIAISDSPLINFPCLKGSLFGFSLCLIEETMSD
jgi:hypothetical protein